MTARMATFALAGAFLGISAAAVAQEDSRDAKIRALEQRLDALQRRLDAIEGGAITPSATPVPAAPAAPPPQAQAAPVSPTGAKYGAQRENELSDEEIGLALQSTLLQKGAALLPPWSVQLIPEIDYSYLRTSNVTVLSTSTGSAVAAQDARSDLIGGSLTLRLGLPWTAQAQVTLPYDYSRSRVVLGGVESHNDLHGIGDIQVGVSKSLWNESDWLPSGLGTVNWKTSTGKISNAPFRTSLPDISGLPLSTNVQRLSLGTGYDSLTGSLSLSKRQDPLVFFGSIGYTHNFTGHVFGGDFDPADVVGTSVGVALAASPATSLSVSLNLGFSGKSKINGTSVPGSDQVTGLVELGAATVLTRDLLVNGTAGFGITQGTPDFVLGLSLPIQF